MKMFTGHTEDEIKILLGFIKLHLWWWDPVSGDRHFENESTFQNYVHGTPLIQEALKAPYKNIPVLLGKRSEYKEWQTAIYLWRLQIGK